ncbi:hypothetical protein AAFM46_16805 (plasmid) [Arthrobacter sp. TMP15]|uniref:hypothetical protein n=1 Tax=Arthrobacter sp. TMP15 TaxID=3140789 RepID=UPI0031BA7B14
MTEALTTAAELAVTVTVTTAAALLCPSLVVAQACAVTAGPAGNAMKNSLVFVHHLYRVYHCRI